MGKIILKELTCSSRRSDSRVRREVREREKNKEEEGQRREPSRVSPLSPRCFFPGHIS